MSQWIRRVSDRMVGWLRGAHEIPSFQPAELIETKYGGHIYKAPGTDEIYPSVTTMNSKLNPFMGSFGQKRWFETLGGQEEGKLASSFTLAKGSWVHRIVERFLTGQNINILFPVQIQQALGNLLPYLINISEIIGCEIPLYSHKMRLAGTADCIASYYGKLSCIDFKTSTKEKRESNIKNYFVQATAYSRMWFEMTGQKIEQIVILVTCDTGQRQEFIKNPEDYEKDLDTALQKFEGLR